MELNVLQILVFTPPLIVLCKYEAIEAPLVALVVVALGEIRVLAPCTDEDSTASGPAWPVKKLFWPLARSDPYPVVGQSL